MSTLKSDLNLASPDDIYNLIVDAHKGLSPEQSEKLNAALVLLLANHVGDEAVIREAVAAARRTLSA
jgi:hypothetical protein